MSGGGYRKHKRDANHVAIVKALQAAGRKVIDLSGVGKDCPDILVSWGGGPNLLMEIKVPGGELSPGQRKWFGEWPGPKVIVRSEREALEATGVRL